MRKKVSCRRRDQFKVKPLQHLKFQRRHDLKGDQIITASQIDEEEQKPEHLQKHFCSAGSAPVTGEKDRKHSFCLRA